MRFSKLMRKKASKTLQALLPASQQPAHAIASSGDPVDKLDTSNSFLQSTLNATTTSHSRSSTSVGSKSNASAGVSVLPNRTPTATLRTVECKATPASKSAKKAALLATAPSDPPSEHNCTIMVICVRGYSECITTCSSCRIKCPSNFFSSGPGMPTRGRTITSMAARSNISRDRNFGSRGPYTAAIADEWPKEKRAEPSERNNGLSSILGGRI
mmetsp:Transcript_105862/g.167051  ORF Transcript_105862/g.167051 Transcript_105862/m.167051 type:complete len:214 (+) Transcript_105862:46-687(+)